MFVKIGEYFSSMVDRNTKKIEGLSFFFDYALTTDKIEMVREYRKMNSKKKARAIDFLNRINASGSESKAHIKNISINGDIGFQIIGDVLAPQTIHIWQKKIPD